MCVCPCVLSPKICMTSYYIHFSSCLQLRIFSQWQKILLVTNYSALFNKKTAIFNFGIWFRASNLRAVDAANKEGTDLSYYTWMHLWFQCSLSLTMWQGTHPKRWDIYGEALASLPFLLLNKSVPAYNQLDSTSQFQEAGKKSRVYNDILATGLWQENDKSYVRKTGFLSLILVLFCFLMESNMLSRCFRYWR